MDDDLAQVRALKGRAKALVEAVVPVVGVGVTKLDGRWALKVNLGAALPVGASLPNKIDGVPLVVEIVGSIRPRDAAEAKPVPTR